MITKKGRCTEEPRRTRGAADERALRPAAEEGDAEHRGADFDLIRHMNINLLSSMLETANVQGSKSTALQPMIWVIGTIIAGIFTTRMAGLDDRMTWTLIIFLGVALAVMLGLTIYFAVKKPDLLRSERFNLQKLAIESKLGDDIHGFKVINMTNTEVAAREGTEQPQITEPTPSPEPKRKPKQIGKAKRAEETEEGLTG
jgi:hypothetical protein